MNSIAQKAKEIFVSLVDGIPESDRERRADEACRGDAELRRRVRALLLAHAHPDSRIEHAALDLPLTVDPALQVTEKIGALIGPYKLLEQVGEGGMGVVYVAEQTEPVRRRVALKVIKPGMDTKQVIARFEAERQALAMMDHPHIARVLDAGTTEQGRPYFVMELVRGMPITEYCDKARLSPRQRLELFIDVCQAVQHAHQKGIIHRDLKPSNVMVTTNDGRPVVKVIDFGVVKAVGQQLTERTVYTALTQLVGTPLYMSPEQAELTSNDVDTRSDVYSLGVLLYELLTGQTPFDKERLKSAGFDEMRRIIREEEPPRPSHRVSTLGAQASSTLSQQRSLDERHLGRVLRGELDWIVMKALEKDRSRRYESASALAADIQRYLSDEPVLACPPTAMYRFQKFARKHRPALATAAAIAVCLLLGTTVSAWQAVRATTAEGQAKEAAAGEAEQRERAEANEQKAVENEQKAVANATAAQEKEQEAVKQRDEVKALADKLAAKDQQLQRTLYAAHMNLARHAWTEAALPRLHELLEQHRPKADQNDLRGFEWHYFHRLSHAELMTLEGDAEFVNSVACSKDGKLIAGSSLDDIVLIWDAKTGNQLRSLAGHTKQINRVAFSPDGKRVASASGDGTVKVWDVEAGKELLSLQGEVDRRFGFSLFYDVDFSPDGTRVAGADIRGDRVTIWNAQTGEQSLSIPNAGSRLTFSPDGEQLATKGRFNAEQIKIWNAKTGALIRAIASTDFVDFLAYSPDGQRLATTLQTKKVKIWDVQTRKELLALEGHTGTVNCVAFSPDGKSVATGGADRLVKVWDAETGRELFTLKGHPGEVWGVAFFPNGQQLVSSGRGLPIIWDITKEPGPITISGDKLSSITAVAISPDGAHIAGGAERPRINEPIAKVWDAQTGKELFTIEGRGGEVAAVAFSPDGKRLASANVYRRRQPGVRAEVKLWDVQTGRELLNIPAPGLNGRPGLNGQGTDVVFSPDGKRLFACGGIAGTDGFFDEGPGEIKVWDAETGAELMSLKHDLYVGHMALSADGKLLAGWAPGAGIKIWDLQNDGHEVLQIKDQGGPLAFSPDGKRLAARDKVWDVTTGKELLELKGHSAWITGLAYSTDGKRLATASKDQTVKIWDAETGDELLTLEGHDGNSNGVAFTANGSQLAAGGPDGTIKIYDATPLPEKP